MARIGGRDRGLFQRKSSPEWWIRWTCPYGHEHAEKVGPKSLARTLYQQRKVAVKTDGYCLAQDRERQRREQATLFRDGAEIMSRFLPACMIALAREYFSISLPHRLKNLAA